MAWSSDDVKWKALDKVAEVIAACGDDPVTRETLATLIGMRQDIFPAKYDFEIKHRDKWILKCLENK